MFFYNQLLEYLKLNPKSFIFSVPKKYRFSKKCVILIAKSYDYAKYSITSANDVTQVYFLVCTYVTKYIDKNSSLN